MAANAEHPTRTMTEQNLTNEIAVSPVTINKSLGDVYDDSSNFPVSAVQRATAMIAAAAQIQPLPKYLAIEGPIGVGKTTLARKLADVFAYPLMLEPVTENPFLDRFYAEGASQALPTQLFFLLHRARQVGDMPGNDLLDRFHDGKR
jgi:hypothetical protein